MTGDRDGMKGGERGGCRKKKIARGKEKIYNKTEKEEESRLRVRVERGARGFRSTN